MKPLIILFLIIFTTLDASSFEERCHQLPPSWITETVENDLRFFTTNKISQRALNITYEKVNSYPYPVNRYLHRFRIVNNKVYGFGEFFCPLMASILKNLVEYSLNIEKPLPPALDVIFCLIDGIPLPWDPADYWIVEDQKDQAPILCAWKRKTAPYVIPVPQRHAMLSCHQEFEEVYAGISYYPWERKQNKLFWKGGTSDIDLKIYENFPPEVVFQKYTKCSRFIICQLAHLYPELITAGFNSVGPRIEHFLRDFRALGSSIQKHIQYKYQILIDGFGGMGSGGNGYEWRLLSNCLTFKQESPNITWFEKGLKPYAHFIPVQNDLLDLMEKLEWAMLHEMECQQISKNATDFANNYLKLEDRYYYLNYLFHEYAKCQTFTEKELTKDILKNSNWTCIQ